MGDRVQIQQLVLNLIGNALDAMAREMTDSRRLTITARRNRGLAVIGVADTGPGLAADERGRIFEAFYSTKPRGMGMGLAISRSIVRAHGGEIRLLENEPRGCRFEISFPLFEPGPAPVSHAIATQAT
ncbi:sensor histidine kinase [Oceaniglobus roseus]|uniref:sensor histidine kinase n=1 Tax=Oceaniglobus roseus TaxID=1737570 RepID=UPI000C7EA5D6|nr:ATP-binding protein [Kandeliimicrobium roseum]